MGPTAVGLVLGVGFLHRAFMTFAVAGVAAATYRETGRSHLANQGWVARAAIGFAAVWVLVDQPKRRVNTMGPLGGATATAPLTLQLQTLLGRLMTTPSLVGPKLRQAFTEVLPDLLGMRAVEPFRYGVNATVSVGTAIIGATLLAAVTICAVRVVASLTR